MRALVRRRYGSPDVLSLEDVAEPVATGDRVLVRVKATALNASDLEFLTGRPLYGRIHGPFRPRVRVLGSDVAGVVEAVGPKASRFQPGDAVYGDIFEVWGGLAERVCAPERMLRRKPQAMSFVQAAALPQSGAIALQGIRDKGRTRAGQRVLVNGAGGGGGSFAIQVAKHLGCEVTAVDSAGKLELMRSLGADRVIDYAAQDVTALGERWDLVLDLVGHHPIRHWLRSLDRGGRYRLVGGPVRYILGTLTLGTLVTLFTSRSMGILPLRTNEGLDVLEELAASGDVVPSVERTWPLEQGRAAFEHLAAGRARGKLVVTVGTSG